MKKFCALLVLVAIAAGSVFAAPSGAAAQIAAAVEDDLFADVEAVELSAEEGVV